MSTGYSPEWLIAEMMARLGRVYPDVRLSDFTAWRLKGVSDFPALGIEFRGVQTSIVVATPDDLHFRLESCFRRLVFRYIVAENERNGVAGAT